MMAFTIHATKTNRSRLIEHALGGEEAAIAAATSLRCGRVSMAAPTLQPFFAALPEAERAKLVEQATPAEASAERGSGSVDSASTTAVFSMIGCSPWRRSHGNDG